MDRAKIFRDYFLSRQNAVLIPNEKFGRRKFLSVGISRSQSFSRIEEITNHNTDIMKSGTNKWVHPPDAITHGHILYTVKFYGECEVDSPKGSEVVRDAIRKRKFNKTIRKTEGTKTPKVELSISADGVIIQELKTKIVKHQYPIHRISYCADDKSDTRMFSFIAKAADSNKHFCYVFASDKNAEQITLTIGQAFDLAYRKFMETQVHDGDQGQVQLVLQKKVQTLERENAQLKARILELERQADRANIDHYNEIKQSDSPKLTSVGRKLENLMFVPSTPPQSRITNGTANSPSTPVMISPPPPSTRSRAGKSGTPATPATPTTPPPAVPQRSEVEDDLASVFMNSTVPQQLNLSINNNASNQFMSVDDPAFKRESKDPFGMTSFKPEQKKDERQGNEMGDTDNDFLDLQAGFNEGLSLGTADFGMDDFDPLSTGC